MAKTNEQLALLFPGQGSQTADMREAVQSQLPDLLELARSEVSDDLFERAGEGTRWAQPAIFCAALAGYELLKGRYQADLMAGHSLGEITALVAADGLDPADGLRLVAAATGLTIANDNAPDQLVLSGALDALDRAEESLRERKVRAKRLPVGGAFHSPLMEPAIAPYREVVEGIDFREPRVPVFSCVTAAPFEDVREQLVAALTHPVRWTGVMSALRDAGATSYVETGPGRVLTNLVRKSLDGVQADAPLAMEAASA
jgi:malonyl CoA-acyl carrier protein transacylase